MDLLKRGLPVGDCYRAAQLWEWAGVVPTMTPIGVSHFGDLFLEGEDGAWFVDVMRGTVTREWASREDLFDALRSREAQDRFLRAADLRRVVADGPPIDPMRVLVPRLPASLGGSLAPAELSAEPVLAAHQYFAQLHQRIRELEPGVAVYGITTDETGKVSLKTGAARDSATTAPDSRVSGMVQSAITATTIDRYGEQPQWLIPPPGLADFGDGGGIAAIHAGRYWHLVSSALAGAGLQTRGKRPTLFELSLKVPAAPADNMPPTWALLILAKIVDGIQRSTASVASGHRVELPQNLLATGWVRPWPAYLLIEDTDLAEVSTPEGVVRLLQIVSLPAADPSASTEEVQGQVKAVHDGDPHMLSPPLLPIEDPDVIFTTMPGDTGKADHAPPDALSPALTSDPSSSPIELLDRSIASADGGRVLKMWEWVPGVSASMKVVGASRFGDLFLQDTDGVWYLSIVTGRLEHCWPSMSAMLADLAEPEAQEAFLRSQDVQRVMERQGDLAPGSVIAPAAHPALTGSLDLQETQIVQFVAAEFLAAQLHRQVGQLPPGTTVHGVNIEPDGAITLITDQPPPPVAPR